MKREGIPPGSVLDTRAWLLVDSFSVALAEVQSPEGNQYGIIAGFEGHLKSDHGRGTPHKAVIGLDRKQAMALAATIVKMLQDADERDADA